MNRVKAMFQPWKPALFAALASSILLCGGCSRQDGEGSGDTDADGTPSVLPATLQIKRHKKTYVITGIGIAGTNRVAIINNAVVRPGEEIGDGVVLQDVQPTYAIIQVGNTQHLLRPEDIQRELDKKKQ